MKEKQKTPYKKKNFKKKPYQKQQVKFKDKQKCVVTIKRLGINGEGIGYYKRKIIFIPNALPGEEVLVEIVKEEKTYAIGQIVKIRKKSKDRVQPRDNYDVGGIELAHLAYPAQLAFKKDVVSQSLAKYQPAGYQNYELRDTLGMDDPYQYRNKAQFQVRKNPQGEIMAGLYKQNSHYLVDLPTFSTQRPLTMKVMRTVVRLLKKWNVSIYDEKRNRGTLKTIVVRESFATKQAQLVFVTSTPRLEHANELMRDIILQLPEVISIMQNINPGRTSLVWGDKTQHLYGKEFIQEKLGSVTFNLSARAFFQMNPVQTKVLYDEVKKALDLQPDETLVDAYCGVGTIGLYVSDDAKEVRGMDIIPEAIEDACENAKLSQRKNVKYETGKAEDLFPKWVKEGFVPDALVVDPPRTGLDERLIQTILKYRPKKFVYVSCNPSTLAKDLVKLTQAYHVDYIQSVDMFPQTARCEAVVKFTLKDKKD
ncbi:tRNA (Uracil-5-) -methyltransferase [Ligilactobacillus ceti DSM 22408]|uniref:tRNA (Uracil-5-)-methyltransferase n=1 Tax=Ligilactobacillus ceti DSM 22408 TaxID=1122146 RepID=A0A0R2KLN0_9LACO|nr:23S rRNA (uracil(1939)-C(5))-methyltransferase RlmD [Ligilactobacillus ceti]KRN90366.1 tRNA (Uracil-5-) -methyltransferase [Ligilactobacillus ceti DSM 22408]